MNLRLKYYTTVILLPCLIASACNRPDTNARPPDTGFRLAYNLKHPDTIFHLLADLREISGLGMAPNGQHILAVNDEDGLLFYLDRETGALTDTRPFGPDKDYEGVEAVGADIYAVRSNGTLYQIPPSGETVVFPTPLYKGYDVEGLCYDPIQKRLLLACKSKAGQGDQYRHKKAIYAYNLRKHHLEDSTAFLIDRAEIARWKGGDSGFMARLYEYFSSDQAPSAFDPSGLAVNPLDSNLYVIASVGKALAVLHPDGRILHVESLNPDIFRQPEGICFDQQGRLYISSEGKKLLPGKLFRFDPQHN